MTQAILVNNTCLDIRFAEKEIIECIKTKSPLPEEIADCFDIEFFDKDGVPAGALSIK